MPAAGHPPVVQPHAAVAILKRGGLVAYPTEAVWGIGCDPFDEAAVLRLLEAKRRPVDKGLIAIAATIEQLKPLVDFDALPADRLAAVLASWPGPHTWIMPAEATAPRWMTGDHAGIAVRVSAHPVVVELCNAFPGALVSTSANPAGAPPVQRMDEIDAALLASLDGIVAGTVGDLDRPTPIRDAASGATLRS